MDNTLWLCLKIAIENGPVEIVDFPMKDGESFHSYVSLPEGRWPCCSRVG